ncbi:MAG: phosphatidylserine decarboxylase [Clostridia bacterium]|nr:phosphatidylserine decarboxylase [Clostridia bacterium]
MRAGVQPPEDSGALKFLYRTAIGRVFLKLLTARWISKLCGAFLNSRLSKPLIKRFVEGNGINLDDFETDGFRCFNDCFCRKIKEGLRPIDDDPEVLVAPCDGLLSVYRIEDETVMPIKQSVYTVKSLLGNEALAERYRGGVCLVFRLCVDHYHRYCYPVDGQKGENVFLRGRLHTVRPIALETYPVFAQNCREYTVVENGRFGAVLQMEVGAMLVGKIKNLHGAKDVKRGEEKGMFLYGGSTVILMLEKDRVTLPDILYQNTKNGLETPVRMGERISK